LRREIGWRAERERRGKRTNDEGSTESRSVYSVRVDDEDRDDLGRVGDGPGVDVGQVGRQETSVEEELERREEEKR